MCSLVSDSLRHIDIYIYAPTIVGDWFPSMPNTQNRVSRRRQETTVGNGNQSKYVYVIYALTFDLIYFPVNLHDIFQIFSPQKTFIKCSRNIVL